MRARWTAVAAACALALTGYSSAGAVASPNRSSTSHAAEGARSANGRIAYGQWDPKIEAYKLFTVKSDGTGVRNLRVNTDALAWSPDGSKILITDLTGQFPQLRSATINPDGSGFKRLDGTPDPLLDIGCNAWSPDGTRIACQGFSDDHAEVDGLYTLRASDGGDPVRLTSHPGDAPRRLLAGRDPDRVLPPGPKGTARGGRGVRGEHRRHRPAKDHSTEIRAVAQRKLVSGRPVDPARARRIPLQSPSGR